MRILLVEPGKKPVLKEIDGSLKSMQKIVGGTIQVLYPFEEPVALVCNDEGKLLGLPLNRALQDQNGHIFDIIVGTFFLCRAPADSDSLEGLTKEETRVFQRRFDIPEVFMQSGKRIICCMMKL